MNNQRQRGFTLVGSIRFARPDEAARMQGIERSAGVVFASVGMSAIAEDEPLEASVLAAACDAGRVWVYEIDDQAVGYVLVEIVDGCAHIEQVSVHAQHAGQRIGAALVEQVVTWAISQGYPGVTLTTFAQVPWNAPYYQRLGFYVVPEADWTPGLSAIRAAEIEHGLDQWPRVCMRREVGCTDE